MGLGSALVAFERPMPYGITSCLRTIGEGVSELLWPTRCVLCDVPGTLLCDECRLELPYIDPLQACPLCGQAHGKYACVDCNSFIVKHRGRAPDQHDSTRGECDVSRDVPHSVSRGVSHSVSRGVSRKVLGAHANAYEGVCQEETPVHLQGVSRNSDVSRVKHHTRKGNVSRFEHHAAEENVSWFGSRAARKVVSQPEQGPVRQSVSRFEQYAGEESASWSEQQSEKPLDQVASVFEFIDPCRKLITTYKDRKEVRLARVLAELLVGYIDPAWIRPGNTAIVVIPARKQAIRERGFDHMKLVGEKLAELTGLPLVDAIEPNERGDQRGLSAFNRQRNMYDSFLPKSSLNAALLSTPPATPATLATPAPLVTPATPAVGLLSLSETHPTPAAGLLSLSETRLTSATPATLATPDASAMPTMPAAGLLPLSETRPIPAAGLPSSQDTRTASTLKTYDANTCDSKTPCRRAYDAIVNDTNQRRCEDGTLRTSHVMSHTISHMPAHVILVDDVLTTGATLTSGATTLKQMGVGKVFGLTVARLP